MEPPGGGRGRTRGGRQLGSPAGRWGAGTGRTRDPEYLPEEPGEHDSIPAGRSVGLHAGAGAGAGTIRHQWKPPPPPPRPAPDRRLRRGTPPYGCVGLEPGRGRQRGDHERRQTGVRPSHLRTRGSWGCVLGCAPRPRCRARSWSSSRRRTSHHVQRGRVRKRIWYGFLLAAGGDAGITAPGATPGDAPAPAGGAAGGTGGRASLSNKSCHSCLPLPLYLSSFTTWAASPWRPPLSSTSASRPRRRGLLPGRRLCHPRWARRWGR